MQTIQLHSQRVFARKPHEHQRAQNGKPKRREAPGTTTCPHLSVNPISSFDHHDNIYCVHVFEIAASQYCPSPTPTPPAQPPRAPTPPIRITAPTPAKRHSALRAILANVITTLRLRPHAQLDASRLCTCAILKRRNLYAHALSYSLSRKLHHSNRTPKIRTSARRANPPREIQGKTSGAERADTGQYGTKW